MERFIRIFKIIISLFVYLTILSSCVPIKQFVHPVSLNIDFSLIETGDLVFRRGNSMVSHFILSTDGASSFSHVGIAHKIDNKIFIIHSVIDDSPTNKNDAVRIEPIETFLQIDNASSAAVYRLDKTKRGYISKAISLAYFHIQNETRFDLDFDLKTTTSLYCTEFVWRIYLDAGFDLIEGNFAELSVPFNKGAYILPSTLTKSRWLELIYIIK